MLTEAALICEMLDKHCDGIWAVMSTVPKPDAERDNEYRQVFKPFANVSEFRESINKCPPNKTGRPDYRR